MRKLAKFILLVFAVLLILNFFTGKNKLFSNPASSSLKEVVENSINGAEGRYGIYIKNLKNKEGYFREESETFEAGSLYKLWLMTATFAEIKKGNIQENEPLIADVATLNKKFDLGSDEAELQEGEIEFSVKSAIEQMITISHNYAALTLLDKMGNQGVPVDITASQTGLFFEDLYKGEVIDQEYSQKMMDILSRQTINDRIPRYLPEGTKVAHKTADIGFFEHDGGIVFSSKGDFIIVVLSETKDPAAAGDTIARISEAVYKYFMEQPASE